MMKQNKNLLTISEAAEFLGVSMNTLRIWDAKGKLKPVRSAGGHRYYSKEGLELFAQDLFSVARVWAESPQAPELSQVHYCQTRDVFQARLERIAHVLDAGVNSKELAPLITAVAGEIGNNSFDHNFGNWPDVPGTFFAHDLSKRIIVLADRGVGIRATLLRVRPDIKDDIAALRVAFTEQISGRAPEQRGNGLKFVRNVATENAIGIYLQSGTAFAGIAKDRGSLTINLADRNIRGVLANITY